MDDNLYDEFGVYIGPDLDDEDAFSDHDQGAFESGQQADLAGDARMDLGTLRCGLLPPFIEPVVLSSLRVEYCEAVGSECYSGKDDVSAV